MNINITDVETFKKIINSFRELIISPDYGELIFSKEKIYMKTIDTSKVIFIDLMFNETMLENSNINKQIKLAINFENFHNILKIGKYNNLSLIYVDTSDKLTIQMLENRKKIKFNMQLQESSDKTDIQIDDIDYNIVVYIDSVEFQKSIKDLSTFGNKCSINICDNIITFSILGNNETGDIEFTDTEIDYIYNKETYCAKYDLKYLNFFAKANLSQEIILKFGKDVPMCFEYNLGYGYVKFYLTCLME